MTGIYGSGQALAAVFVSVYLWVNSHDFGLVCRHYLALYIVTPFVFLLAGWYSQARDRLHMYRLGLVLHLAYYCLLLALRERSPDYAVVLGAFLGVTWGVFYAASNTFNFDVSVQGKREYFVGLLQTTRGAFRLFAPLLGGLVIKLAPERLDGYHRVFGVVIVLYAMCFALSFAMPRDNTPRPFRLRRALFPGKEQRDWRLIMLATIVQGGRENIFAFLLGLLIFLETGDELSVGGLASFQAIAGLVAAYLMGLAIAPRNRQRYMLWGTVFLVAGAAIVATRLTLTTLIVFGFLRSISGPMFGIPHASLRLDTIMKSAEEPAQRIEYMSAREVPLALGRILMMLFLIGLHSWLSQNALGLRIAIFTLCSMRIGTYLILCQTSAIRQGK